MRPTPEFRRPPPDPLEKATAERILSISRWSEKLFSVKVSRSPAFRFTPGQWVRLGIPSGSGLPGSVIWRPYSMVSADYPECFTNRLIPPSCSSGCVFFQPTDNPAPFFAHPNPLSKSIPLRVMLKFLR